MSESKVRRTYRGVDGVDAVLEEAELRDRIDEPDPGYTEPGDYDLKWARQRLEDEVERRAETPDEAIEELAVELGKEPVDELDDDYDR